MFRVVPSLTPARLPAFLFAGVLLLQGCSLLPKDESAPVGGAPVQSSARDTRKEAFTVDVRAPDAVRNYLLRHLEIQRYKQVDDLGASEVSRLMVAAEANARILVAAAEVS